jgi:hypothetical protein
MRIMELIMLRACSMFGMGGIFLLISPKLRGQVFDALGSGVSAMDRNAPYSYIAGGILVFCVMVYSFNAGSKPR